MSKLFFFKVTFLAISVGLFTGMVVFGLFDLNFSDNAAILNLLGKSLFIALVVGLVLGVINMYARVGIPLKGKW